MADDDLEDFQPLRKKPRFKAPLTDDEMANVSKGFVPPNTRKNTTWAMRVFIEWKAERNKAAGSPLCPDNLLERPNPAQINTWLSRFVTEARKQNGEPYPPRTMHQILLVCSDICLKYLPTLPNSWILTTLHSGSCREPVIQFTDSCIAKVLEQQ